MMKLKPVPFGWKNAAPGCAHEYILPAVLKEIENIYRGRAITIYDIGCGNGYVSSRLAEHGHQVSACDSCPDGIDIARKSYPSVEFVLGSIYDGSVADAIDSPVDCVISLEVVEHLFHPRKLFEQSYGMLKTGGHLLVSTPYHGYLKNLVLSLVNGWDRHFGVEWEGGHIKFFSRKTLAKMACGEGFKNPRFVCVGRIPGLWKSMIMVVEK